MDSCFISRAKQVLAKIKAERNMRIMLNRWLPHPIHSKDRAITIGTCAVCDLKKVLVWTGGDRFNIICGCGLLEGARLRGGHIKHVLK